MKNRTFLSEEEKKTQQLENQLANILTKSKSITSARYPTLTELNFPSKEIWRFFVEEDRQNKGNSLLEQIVGEIKKVEVRCTEVKKEQVELEEKLKQHAKETKEYQAIADRIKELTTELSLGKEISVIENILKKCLQEAKQEIYDALKKLETKKITALIPVYKLCKISISYAELTCKKLQKDDPLLSENLETLLKYSNGWLQFEATEPGCVAAFIRASHRWNNVIKSEKKDVKTLVQEHIRLIKTFHGDATLGVSGELLPKEREVKKIRMNSQYEFRNEGTARFFFIVKDNFAYTLSNEGLKESKNRWDELMDRFLFYKIQVVHKKNENWIVSNIHGQDKKEIEENIEIIASFLLEEYFNKMTHAHYPLAKLIYITHLIRDLEQLHPFTDANCRTICTLYLNYLLITNGFPPAILPNPNHFDGCDTIELLEDILEGMRRTLAVSQGKKELSGICTDDVHRFLTGHIKYRKELDYAIQYVFKLPGIPTPDQYQDAINILQEYIKNYSWNISYMGGAEIKINESKTIKVPQCVFDQWKVICNIDKTPEKKYKEIIDIAIAAYKDQEGFSNARKFFGGRSEKTTEYLMQFYLGMLPEEMMQTFALPLKKQAAKEL